MKNLEKLNINLHGIDFEPLTCIKFVMKSGAEVTIKTPISHCDFPLLWNSIKRKLTLLTGKESYATIKKSRVDFYHVEPITK